MPSRRCPACGKATPRLLEHTSHMASVNYFACNHCGHVWTTSKDGKTFLDHVTPHDDTPRPKEPS